MPTATASRDSVLAALDHRQPARLPIDLGSTTVTGMHVSCVAALRDHYGIANGPVKVIDPGQMLGEIAGDLKEILGIDTQPVMKRMGRFGFPLEDWKPYRMYDGLEVLVPGRFNVTLDSNGDTLLYPQGDLTAAPGARMPAGGYFFDSIIRQPEIDEDRLDPADNLEDFPPIADAELDHLEREAKAAAATGRAVVGNFGGTGLGDIAWVPGSGLLHPRGIRDVAEWYMSINSRREYVRSVFEGQVKTALSNLEKIARRTGDAIDVINICGTDFGTQTSSFCSLATFRDLWLPFYQEINRWVHTNTRWKTFKHSCGAVEKFIPSFLEAGFDILNPVQCSAQGMDPRLLKDKYGDRIVFWGGGVDTQKTLPFGTPSEVREQVLKRCEIFARGGGFVFNPIHNIQAQTPVENIVAMFGALREFRA
jgi:hypothetical protein